MAKRAYKYIYGPVSSWRLGRSLGVDPISGELKICTFDCTYCQAGKTGLFTNRRKVFVPTQAIINEIKDLPPVGIDYITFSGKGEPTLAKNLGAIIKEIKKRRREKIAVLTNSSLMGRTEVQDDLLLADLVVAKLDAPSAELFMNLNKPGKAIRFNRIIRGLKRFKRRYRGRFALQLMFTRDNIASASEMASLVREIMPDEVQINTPLRPSRIRPLSPEQIAFIKRYFLGLKCLSVYDIRRKRAVCINKEDTIRRRGGL